MDHCLSYNHIRTIFIYKCNEFLAEMWVNNTEVMNNTIQFAVLLLALCSFAYCIRKRRNTCPENEHYTNCKNNCPTPVCSNPRPPSCQNLDCKPGCECNNGFVRIKKPNGKCIPMKNCRECLRSDFSFRECGSLCDNTCEKIIMKPDNCNAVCVPGCYCRDGIYQNITDSCVYPDDCVETCSFNRHNPPPKN